MSCTHTEGLGSLFCAPGSDSDLGGPGDWKVRSERDTHLLSLAGEGGGWGSLDFES